MDSRIEFPSCAFYTSRARRPLLPRVVSRPAEDELMLMKEVLPWDHLQTMTPEIIHPSKQPTSSTSTNTRGPGLLERRKREAAMTFFESQILKRLRPIMDDDSTVVADERSSLPPSPTSTPCELELPTQTATRNVNRSVLRQINPVTDPQRPTPSFKPKLKLPPSAPKAPTAAKPVARFSGVAPRRTYPQSATALPISGYGQIGSLSKNAQAAPPRSAGSRESPSESHWKPKPRSEKKPSKIGTSPTGAGFDWQKWKSR